MELSDLCDEALDVPGLGPLAALDEVVCRAVADDEEQEAAAVSVLVFLCELPLQVVHLLAVQVLIDLNIEPYKQIDQNQKTRAGPRVMMDLNLFVDVA